MTNQMIIMMQQEELAKAGILEYTGREIEVTLPDESVMTFKEVEDIHTYAKWKELGFQVKKGEKAVTQFMIWKYVQKKKKETDEENEARMFMKKASFFKRSQVEVKLS